MPEYLKKRRISKRTATTRLFIDDEREVQRRATNEGKERSEIIRQAVSNAFRTERLALSRKDETMQPVIDTYRKFMEEATGGLRNQLIHLTSVVEQLRDSLRGQLATTNEHLETIGCSARYNTEQSIVIRSLMQLYIFDVYHQLEMQCGLDPALMGQALRERINEFRHEAGNEMARIMEDSASSANQGVAERLVDKLYRHLVSPLTEEAREPRW
jgi:metal-responsive CopG/Arc/MetJ family transcriptional regulator